MCNTIGKIVFKINLFIYLVYKYHMTLSIVFFFINLLAYRVEHEEPLGNGLVFFTIEHML